MATYTYYWPEWACDDAKSLEGHAFPVFFGGHNADSNFSRFKVAPGDTVIAVTVVDGALLLLASLEVTFKGLASEWLAKHPGDSRLRFSRHGGQALGGTPGVPLSFGRKVPAKVLADWRFDSGRELKHLVNGKVTRSLAFQGVYRLTERTAMAVREVLAKAPVTRPDALEETLRARPADEASAAVLADRWQEKGDVRGELLSLELALFHAKPAQVPALWARAEALLSKRSASKLARMPGGFPFRSTYARRTTASWNIYAGSTGSTLTWKHVVSRLAGWATVLAGGVRSKSITRVLPTSSLATHKLGAGESFEVSIALCFPGTDIALPFQSKPFSGQLDQRRLTFANEGHFWLSCAVPVLDDGPLLRGLLSRANESLKLTARGREQLVLRAWNGQVCTNHDLLL